MSPNKMQYTEKLDKSFGTMSELAVKYRHALFAMALAGASCSGESFSSSGGSGGESGMNGNGGRNGEGGSNAEGGAGEGGMMITDAGVSLGDAVTQCPDLFRNSLASLNLGPGEIGEVMVDLPSGDPDAPYNGNKLIVPNGGIAETAGSSTWLMLRHNADNVLVGYDLLDDYKGIAIKILDGDNPVDENCNFREIGVDRSVVTDPSKGYIVEQPTWGTPLIVDGGGFIEPDGSPIHTFELNDNGGRIHMADTGIILNANSRPKGSVDCTTDANAYLHCNPVNVSDEGLNTSFVRSNIGISLEGIDAAPLASNPEEIVSAAPLAYGSHDITYTIEGLNNTLGAANSATDRTQGTITVDVVDPCDGIDCSGNGTCNDGVCECDPAWSGANCDVAVPPPAFVVGTFYMECVLNSTCQAGGNQYPFSLQVLRADSCNATVTAPNNEHTPGIITSSSLNGETFEGFYQSGPTAGVTDILEINCDGPGGQMTPYVDYVTLN